MPPLLVVEVELVGPFWARVRAGSEALQVHPKADLYCMLLGKPVQLHLGFHISASANFLGGHDSCFASQSPRVVCRPSSITIRRRPRLRTETSASGQKVAVGLRAEKRDIVVSGLPTTFV